MAVLGTTTFDQRAEGPVAMHGRMQVEGSKILGAKSGKPVSVAGPSFFWSQWMGQFYTPEAVSWIKKDWNAGIVRAAVGVYADGYLSNPSFSSAFDRVVFAVYDPSKNQPNLTAFRELLAAGGAASAT